MKSRTVVTALVGKDTNQNTYTTLDGRAIDRPPFTFVLDGKEHNSPGHDGLLRAERIDERHIRITTSASTGTLVENSIVSPDGKSQRIVRKGNGTSTGRLVDEVYIFERQPSSAK